MAPKRKAPAAKKAAPKKKTKAEQAAAASPTEPEPAQPSRSPQTSKAMGSKMTVADAWSAPYVEKGSMSQGGFSELCGRIGVEEMSFEACYLMYLLVPDVEDVMTVCRSQSALQKAVEGLGCRLVSDCPQKLRSKKAAMVASFDMHSFQPFFRWMFDMGKSISAMNTGAHVGVVRSVPVQVSEVRPHPLQRAGEATSQPATTAAASVTQTGLQLMEAVLSGWALMAKFKEFCSTKDLAPFSKDLWTQIGRFAHLTTTGQIEPDLSNYEDDGSGGGSAWPCTIDDFVEWVLAQ